jgi:uncharacterized membrane protein
MLGFLIGAACLVGLVKMVRMGHGRRAFGGWHGGYGGYGGYGGSCSGRRGWGSHGDHGDWRGGAGAGSWGGGPRAALRALFERLDTSPGQEKVILSALEEMWAKKRAIGDEFVQTRKDVARAMRGEVFDEPALQEAFGRQDELLVSLRATMQVALKTIHDALDERQRGLAGDLLEHGPFGRHFGHGGPPWSRGGGPYRDNVWM